MKPQKKGISLDGLARYWDALTPAEKSRFRQEQIRLAGVRTGGRVLDVGCGTGVLAILARLLVGDAGEAAGVAAYLALDSGQAVQDVDVHLLQKELERGGSVSFVGQP